MTSKAWGEYNYNRTTTQEEEMMENTMKWKGWS